MEQENKQMNSLPDNAYRELAPGEEYKPMMPANAKPKEVTPYSVTFGIIMAVIFSAAAAYLGLHFRTGGSILPDIPFFSIRRFFGYLVIDSFPEIFRERHARKISIPGGNGNHGSFGFR